MHKPIVAFIDSVHPSLWESLEALGFQCEDYSKSLEKEIERNYHTFKGIVLRSKYRITAEVIEKCNQLKFIARSGSGMENIDVSAAEKKGVLCINSPEGNRDALAEHTLGMLLMLFNKLHIANQEVKSGVWRREENRGVELKGKTVGLIGYGVMGKAFAQRLKGFEVEVIAFDKFKSSFSDENAKEVSWEEFTRKSDIISLHVNYLPDNEYFVNSTFFEQFKKPVYFINTARGKCVETKALLEAIDQGKVLGACLDVIEFESVSFENDYTSPLLKELISKPEVVLSPHVAGWTTESYIKLSEFLFKKINENINLINS